MADFSQLSNGVQIRHVSKAAQQLLILEGKLNFCIMSDDDSLKDIDDSRNHADIAKGMRFFPWQLVKTWWEMGMIDETQKGSHSKLGITALRDLRDLGK